MFGWLKSLFASSASGNRSDLPDDLWNALESMDSRNSLARLRTLKLTPEQFPVVKGLIEGSISPADRPGVSDWCSKEDVSESGMDALAFALRSALESTATTYVFSKPEGTPVALIPRFVHEKELTVIVSHVGNTPVVITSLEELLKRNQIGDYSLETLTPRSFRRRFSNQPDFARPAIDRGVKKSVTIEKLADENGQLLEPLDITDLAAAINNELGYDLSAENLDIDATSIRKLGLYTVIAQVDSLTQEKILFWIVSKA